jgi:hypothetical protein
VLLPDEFGATRPPTRPPVRGDSRPEGCRRALFSHRRPARAGESGLRCAKRLGLRGQDAGDGVRVKGRRRPSWRAGLFDHRVDASGSTSAHRDLMFSLF